MYETNFFAPKNPHFKSKAFLKEIKELFTEVCNSLVKNENKKLTVFQTGGPYLATKKIGKNNPKAEEIKTDNYLRQEWNRMVDRGLIEGMQEEELVMMKKDYIDNEVAQSVKEHGYQRVYSHNYYRKQLASFGHLLISLSSVKKQRKTKMEIFLSMKM